MSTPNTMAKAQRLRELHSQPYLPLVFANVWDAASARIVQAAGYPAIATGSAGVAFALGYADGQKVPASEMIGAVARIVRAVEVPVTADVEAGYEDAVDTARALLDVGAVGLNLEDFDGELVPLDRQIEKIRSIRAATPEIVINARTDIFLEEIGHPSTRLDRTVERMRAFERAGANCLFVPGVKDEATIAALVKAVALPVNILAVAGSPSIGRLHELGVGRVSVGSGPMRAVMALTRRIAIELKERGTYESFTRDTIPYAQANALFH